MGYKTYPEYRDSGVQWLGEMPSHWETRRLKYAAPLRNIKIIAGESHLPYVGLENIESWSGKYLVQDAANDLEGLSSRFYPGDVLFGKLRPYLAKAFLADFEGMCSSELLVLQGKGVQPEFLVRFMLSVGFIREVDSSTYGAKMPRASWDFIGNLLVTLPPTGEQTTIAAFLDEKTTQIDQLIEKKTRFIELLKEKRAALITEAVTGKFDVRHPGKGEVPESAGRGFGVRMGKPYAEYKDSGVAWLGEIPVHWEVKRLKHLVRLNPPKSEVSNVRPDMQVQFLPMELVSENGVVSMKETRLLSDVYQGFTYFRDGDVIMAKITPCFENGKGAIVNKLENGIGFGSTEFHVLRPTAGFSGYVWCVTKSIPFRRIGIMEMKGVAGQQRVPESFVSEFLITAPPVNEQSTIVAFLDEKTTQIDQLIEKTQQSINLLKEKRAALITAAVTGKIDVRDWNEEAA